MTRKLTHPPLGDITTITKKTFWQDSAPCHDIIDIFKLQCTFYYTVKLSENVSYMPAGLKHVPRLESPVVTSVRGEAERRRSLGSAAAPANTLIDC